MAETTAPAKVTIEQPENPMVLSVERNGVELNFTEARTTKGRDPGKTTFIPDAKDEAKLLVWVGLPAELADALKPVMGKSFAAASNVVAAVKAKLQSLTLGWAEDSMDEDTGKFIEQKFIKFAQDFSASGETIGELEDQLEENNKSLVKLDLSKPENMAELVRIGKIIQDLQIAIDSKKRTRKVKTVSTGETVHAGA